MILALLGAALMGAAASASTTVGSPVVGAANNYDYSPSVMQTGAVQQFWWCTGPSDLIAYEEIGLSPSPHVIVPETIVLGHGAAGAWDSKFTCNPHVVRGLFVNPLGDGATYTYALYYVALADGASGGNNIGVAFSNDGQTWHKYPTPVITTDTTAYYGVGQPDLYNPDSATGSDVVMVYEHTAAATSHIEATSTDGVHFTVVGTLSTAGLPAQKNNLDDIAYDPGSGTWYGLYDEFPARPSSTTGGVVERGQPGETLYSTTDLLAGTWAHLDTVDTATTGYEANFIGTLLRDPYGNLLLNGGSVEMYISTSIPRPAVTATPAQAAQSGAGTQWDIAWSLWTPGSPLRQLVRYYSGSANTPYLGRHLVTTGYRDPNAFTAESTVLGSVYEAPNGAATQPLYSCKQGSEDFFVSQDPQCESQLTEGLIGYVYPTQPSGITSIPLYRCVVPGDGDHFVSTDPGCEHQVTESLLGFSIAPAG